jgi:hypothetical protein
MTGLSTPPDDARDIITTPEVVETQGQAVYDLALAYDRHHIDLADKPCWTREEWKTVFGLIRIEQGEV